MNQINIDQFPLMKKYFFDPESTRSKIELLINNGNTVFLENYEGRIKELEDCEGFNNKISEIRRNPDNFFYFFSEIKEAAFLKSKGFSIKFPSERPDFIAEKDSNSFCCEVKTIELLEIETLVQELSKLNLPISVELFYSLNHYFDRNVKDELIRRIEEACKESEKSIEEVTVGMIRAKLDYTQKGLISAIVIPEEKPEKNDDGWLSEKGYFDSVWYSIHDHLDRALKSFSYCDKSSHKVVVFDFQQVDFVLVIKEVLYGKESLRWKPSGEEYSLERIRLPDGIFQLEEFRDIEIIIVNSYFEKSNRLILPNIYYHNVENLTSAVRLLKGL